MMKNLRRVLDRMADNIKCGGEEKHKFVKNPQMPEEPPQGSSHTLPHFNTEKNSSTVGIFAFILQMK